MYHLQHIHKILSRVRFFILAHHNNHTEWDSGGIRIKEHFYLKKKKRKARGYEIFDKLNVQILLGQMVYYGKPVVQINLDLTYKLILLRCKYHSLHFSGVGEQPHEHGNDIKYLKKTRTGNW